MTYFRMGCITMYVYVHMGRIEAEGEEVTEDDGWMTSH